MIRLGVVLLLAVAGCDDALTRVVLDAGVSDSSVDAGSRDSSAGVDASTSSSDAGISVCTAFSDPTVAGQIASTELTEASGIIASRGSEGVLFSHNDSGDSARFFALDSSGARLGEFQLTGATFVDTEDIAAGPGPMLGTHYVYLGDIGDNAARTGSGTVRSTIDVYRVVEPTVVLGQSPGVSSVAYERISLVYPGRSHDAESLWVDPDTADLYLITKENQGVSEIYRTPVPLSLTADNTLILVGTIAFGAPGLPGTVLATAADIAPDGRAIVVRTYTSILLFIRAETQSIGAALQGLPVSLPSPVEVQGEAIAFAADGRSLFTLSEGITPELHQLVSNCP